MCDPYDPTGDAVSVLIDIMRGDAPSIYSPNDEAGIVDDYMMDRAAILMQESGEGTSITENEDGSHTVRIGEVDEKRTSIRLSAAMARHGY